MSFTSDIDSDEFVNVGIEYDGSSDSEIDVINENPGVNRRLKRTHSVLRLEPNGNRREAASEVLTYDNDTEPAPKRPRLDVDNAVPSVKLAEFGGYPKVVDEMRRLLSHLRKVEVYRTLGVTPPRGVLIHGPHGSGKTLLANALAGQLGLPLFTVSGMDLLCYSFPTKIRFAFDLAADKSPALVFLDGLEAVADRKDVTIRLAAAMDDCRPWGVMVLGATSQPDALDGSLRTTGRFDREIAIGVPGLADRQAILKVLTAGMKLQSDLSMPELAMLTPGFVGGDLRALTTEAGIAAVSRAVDTTEEPVPSNSEEPSISPDRWKDLFINREDFSIALKRVQPSTKRLGFATVPEVSWDDVGSLKVVKDQLESSILLPIAHPAEFAAMGMDKPSGILLCGPPGCGKTLIAKAVANQGELNFLSVKGPELLNMYVGESERGVRRCFQRAKSCQPCIIFVDEIDALCPKRYGTGNDNGNSTARVVNQFLTEMDGVEDRGGVHVLAATNRPDILDPALLRPGRLEKLIWIGLPKPEDRADILRALTRRVPLRDVDLEAVGKDSRLDGFSGADLSALVKESCIAALLGHIRNKSGLYVTTQLMMEVAAKLKPSVTEKDLALYKQIQQMFGSKKESVSTRK